MKKRSFTNLSHFKSSKEPLENPSKELSENPSKGILQGDQYRITVLTPSLLRLEYSETGDFEDRATQMVVNRDFEVPEYRVREGFPKDWERSPKDWDHSSNNSERFKEGDERFKEETQDLPLLLETSELRLSYDRKEFSPEGLRIEVKAIKGSLWHYGQKPKDLKGTYRTLDCAEGGFLILDHGRKKEIELGPGLISREGFAVIDDSASMAMTEDGWVEPRGKETDLYFFGYGHRYLECLKDFYHLCGRTPLLPRYALGNWWSRYHRYTEAEYKELIGRFEREKLPFSVAVIDMDWHLVEEVPPEYGNGWTGYTWNKKLFPDPEEFLSWLHERHLKVTLNVHPADGVRAFEEIYPRMAEAMGMDPEEKKPVEFDPVDRRFMKAYFEILCHSLEKQGVDFWWVDWQQGEKSRIPGLDPLWMLNHYHYLDSGWKGTRRITFSRYAGVGSHRYPVGFSGDTTITWESLDYQPYFTSTASNIGYGWWSHDIGGHMWGRRDDELMARWVQLGVFSPINRLHSSNNPFSGKEPWNYDAVTRKVMNCFLRLRHSLVPYLYTMNYRAGWGNTPLVLPMYYLEPEREEAYQVPNEYYFGTELIAAPITQPMDPVSRSARVKVWLPEGEWVDFFTGIRYRGGRMLAMRREIEEFPVLMKAGAIVPMKDMGDDLQGYDNSVKYDNSVENPEALEVRIFPAAEGSFVLKEDQGDSLEDLPENWADTEMRIGIVHGTDAGETQSGSQDGRHGLCFIIKPAKGNLSVIPKNRSWKLIFYGAEKQIPAITIGGCAVNPEEFLSGTGFYEEERRLLTVEVKDVPVTQEIRVCFPAGVEMAENNYVLQSFEILKKAQMDYGWKERIWDMICREGENAGAFLEEADLPECVRESLLELLTAQKLSEM